MSGYTPLIQQYLDIKARHPDSLLFFRVGDFYEMFFEDAREGSGLLGLTLTSRNNGSGSDVPLAGIPVKAVDEYLPRLLREGRRVAICEQVEDAAEADGLVRREVVEVITPGTVLDDTLLSSDRNNFVAALAGDDPVAIATADFSTGEFEVRACPRERLAGELARIEPAELVVAGKREDVPRGRWTVTRREGWQFEPDLAEEHLRRQFEVLTTEGFGLSEPELVSAAGVLVGYLEEVRPAGLGHLRPPRVERTGRYMHLDEMTRRNLELVEPLRPEGGGTLLEVIDRTLTAMGGRLLRRWLLQPLLELEEIVARQGGVAELADQGSRRRSLRETLGDVRDLERLAGKLSTGRAAPRELLALGGSLAVLPDVAEAIGEPRAGRLRELLEDFDPLDGIRAKIEEAIAEDAPPVLQDGGVIREGYSEELDELRATRDEATEFIAGIQTRERERTGIGSLKVGHNKVFGYYLEVTKANLDRVPDEYHRKQTLTNAERYFTPELKEWEEKVVRANERIADLEASLFRELREELGRDVSRIQRTAARVAQLDVLSALAEVAVRCDYTRPTLTRENRLEIREGRHPVVERMIAREEFIPNDVTLDGGSRIMILTGPNMSGKSTVLRQVGLIVLMSQIGGFVPATAAEIGLCDRIFTRVGASDNLVRGQSTFMVEMTETATILNSATERSLVLLDEIGRGTSTYDGVSIAWSVTEHLHDDVGARTIFATHYHELVELADRLESVAAFNVSIREADGEIVFLRRLEPGGCDRSYGVQVARLAGLPGEVIERARGILHRLENGPAGTGSRLAGLGLEERDQLALFGGGTAPGGGDGSPAAAGRDADAPARGEDGPAEADGRREGTAPTTTEARRVLERLGGLEIDNLTPLEALNLLAELRTLLPDVRSGEAP